MLQSQAILNNVQDGIIIKAIKDNSIVFANEIGCKIICAKLDFSDIEKRVTGNWLNTARFCWYDIDEDKDPYLDGVKEMVIHGERQSLNEIVESLKDDGAAFSDNKIYKVIHTKSDAVRTKADGERPVQYISVEVTQNVFKAEPVLTIYLRDLT